MAGPPWPKLDVLDVLRSGDEGGESMSCAPLCERRAYGAVQGADRGGLFLWPGRA